MKVCNYQLFQQLDPFESMKKACKKCLKSTRKHVNQARSKARIKRFKPHKLRITRAKTLIQFV